MDLSSLEIFRAVAHEASVTRAAQQLQRAQSNVTTRIRQLEDLGVELFLRDGKRMSLTERGSGIPRLRRAVAGSRRRGASSMHPAEPGGRLLGSMEHRGQPPAGAAGELSQGLSAGRPGSLHRHQSRVVRWGAGAAPGLRAGGRRPGLGRRTRAAACAASRCSAKLLMILPAEHPPVHDVAEVRLRTLAGFARGCTYRQLAEDSLGTPLTVQEVGSMRSSPASPPAPVLACCRARCCNCSAHRRCAACPCRSRHLAGLARRLRDRRLRTLARPAGARPATERPGANPTAWLRSNPEPSEQ